MWSKFWTEDLWNFRLSEVKGYRKLFYTLLRIGALSVKGFIQDQCSLRASSLTYYTMVSIVPLLALAFAIARGFGFQTILRDELLKQFQQQEAVITEMIVYADRVLQQTSGGVLALVGIGVLLYSCISILRSMEATVNQIWEVTNMRSIRLIVGEYMALLVIAPVLFVLADTSVVFVENYLESAFHRLPWGDFLITLLHFGVTLIPYILFWGLFSFLYYFLPNTKVAPLSAMVGGIISGSSYIIAQWGYFYFQVGVSSYGAIYGSLAALPLFLLWVQLSWYIFLFGAEISHAHQSLERHEFAPRFAGMSYKFKQILSLWILDVAARRFRESYRPITFHTVVRECKIPMSIAIPLLEELSRCGLLREVQSEETAYMLGKPLESLRISDAIEALEGNGSNDLPFVKSKELARFEHALHAFAALVEKSPKNFLLGQM